ncbi:MAG: carbohydrate-binding domain-containing protein [Eubacterium sp.]|nr:carbohydrate-binding domain-containing protein [Eubacterium sp.]
MKAKIIRGLTAVLFAAAVLTFGTAYSPLSITAEAAEYTYDMSEATDNVTIDAAGTYYITGSSESYNVQVTTSSEDDKVTLVLDNVTITSSTLAPISLSGAGEVTIILKGTNTLTNTGNTTSEGNAGIYKGTDGKLIIEAYEGDSEASLTAVGGYTGAGIGGKYKLACSGITINGGTVTATGGYDAAGIGGGYTGDGTYITISGGTVTATAGGDRGAGIGGGGSGGDGTNITIKGGVVTATGGARSGAGIGGAGGSGGNCTDITISGGIVTAVGNYYSYGTSSKYMTSYSAPGIGAGCVTSTSGTPGKAENIKITGGTVTAIGGSNSYTTADGIGYGVYYTYTTGLTYTGEVSNVVIDKASVKLSSLSVQPVNLNGDSVYLYTIPDTTEGDTIYIDGEEFISSVNYHSDDDDNQYLYLANTSSAAKAVSVDCSSTLKYTLTFDSENSVGIVTLDETEENITLTDGTVIYPTFVDSGVSVLTDDDEYLLGIVVDTTVYGGEGAAYLEGVGVIVDNVLYEIENYYYIDDNGDETESSTKAFFPVTRSGSTDSSAVDVRGAVYAGTETEQGYYASPVTEDVIIKASESGSGGSSGGSSGGTELGEFDLI